MGDGNVPDTSARKILAAHLSETLKKLEGRIEKLAAEIEALRDQTTKAQELLDSLWEDEEEP